MPDASMSKASDKVDLEYYKEFDSRLPPDFPRPDPCVQMIWHTLATASVGLGFWYIIWRWTASLNPDAMVFSLAVIMAETLMFVGMLLFYFDIWNVGDQNLRPVRKRMENGMPSDNPATVDVFITTYTEDPSLVRLSIQAAKKLKLPVGSDVKIWVLDDGARDLMKDISHREQVNYLSRADNLGFKAGNIRNAILHSTSEYIVICDADTRVMPEFLNNTLGYFEDPDVAWVQTPHWNYDIPPGVHLERFLPGFLRAHFEKRRGSDAFQSKRQILQDPFFADSRIFFDIIQRRRDRNNASFCCGAASIHRREALLEGTLRREAGSNRRKWFHRWSPNTQTRLSIRSKILEPFRFHVSEDFFTSLLMHSDPKRKWKSVFHPQVEAKMLSPWDLHSWTVQNYKYAGGTLDVLFRSKGYLTSSMSLCQKLHYSATFWSYLTPLWGWVFLVAPIVSMSTGIAPMSGYTVEFFVHLLPFILIHELALVFGFWGTSVWKGRLLSQSITFLVLQAMWSVMLRRPIKFKVTPKSRTSEVFWTPVLPHIVIIVATVFTFLIGLHRYANNQDPGDAVLLIFNGFWGAVNIFALTRFALIAAWRPEWIRPKGLRNAVQMS